MPTPIKPTSIITGKDASNFLRVVKENHKKKVSKETLKIIREQAAMLNDTLRQQ